MWRHRALWARKIDRQTILGLDQKRQPCCIIHTGGLVMNRVRVVHYVNQFFAGIGGEEKAGTLPGVKEGPVGPGQLLQSFLAEEGEIVATVYCGDNYMSEKWKVATDELIRLISDFHPSLVIAGPAFSSGRHGLACGGLCHAVQEKLGIPAVTGMYEENPAVELYRSKIYIIPTHETTAGMKEAISRMARLGMKLASGQLLGPAAEEGYLPRGWRQNEFEAKAGAERALDMLMMKIKGEPFITELPLPKYDKIPPSPPIKDMRKATIALVTEGGCVPKGNPDRIESGWATKWSKYSIAGLSRLSNTSHECVHGGFDTTFINEDPNRLVPLDTMRELVKEHFFGKLHDYYYVTVGSMGSILTMKRFGAEIAEDLKAAKVNGVLLTAT